MTVDFASIRAGLADLPRADNHMPGARVDPSLILPISSHRAALDPDRALVVANRGMGKSFWAHALADPVARDVAAKRFGELGTTDAEIGFNASDRTSSIAPTPTALNDALKATDADSVWRAVLVRASGDRTIPPGFSDLARWVQSNGERVDDLLTALDDRVAASGRKFVIVFDALDRLAPDWDTTRRLTTALLRRALAVRSFRALRIKLFMRRDQFEDDELFAFADGSKIKNTRVDLTWTSMDLYRLLFERLAQSGKSASAFANLRASVATVLPFDSDVAPDVPKLLIDAIAGEFMGADKKRGRTFSWLPLHLSDANGETSPRTFLTAWREAAHHGAPPAGRAVDHLGILEGVRKASEDRLVELKEDYWWIDPALRPLRGEMVPMDRERLESLWRSNQTAEQIAKPPKTRGLPPIQLVEGTVNREGALVQALSAIGVMEIRANGKINVPDIFRVEAGIKRKGGVKPPRGRRDA